MKKILVAILILGLIGVIGLNGVNKKIILSESEDIYCEVPLSVFSRYPAESFLIPIIILNKSETEKKITGIEFYKEDGTLILNKKIEEVVKGANIKISDDEIRNKIGLMIPDKEIVEKAMNLLEKAKILEKSDERNKKIESSWYLLTMNYKGKEIEDKEIRNLLPYFKILNYEITLEDLNIKIEPPDFINIKIKIIFLNPDNSTTSIDKETTLFYLTSLPSQWGWYPGDGHMHTTYSDGGSTIMQRRDQAYNSGLKWIIITDHGWSYIINNWNQYKTDCTNAQNKTPNITVCPGEEIATSDTDSHYLSYKMDNCAPLLDHTYDRYGTIYWVIYNGLIGFVAHPYSTPYTWEDWYNYDAYINYDNSGPRGIELISGGYVISDTEIQDWDNFLKNHLSVTMKDSKHRFCVGLGNSDEHGYWPYLLYLGKKMTYIYTGSSSPPGTYRTGVYNAIERGYATASSDGSLLIHKITTGGTYLPGYYIKKSSAGYVTVNIYAKRVISQCDEATIKIVTIDGTLIDYISNQYEINKNYSIYVNRDTYVRAEITFYDSTNGYSYCFSNPIFIDFPPYGS